MAARVTKPKAKKPRRKKTQQEILGADISEIKFAKEVVRNGGNATQAARDISETKQITEGSAKVRGHKMMQRESVQELIKIEMDRYDITPGKLASVLAERLNDSASPAQQLAAWDRCMQLLGWDPKQKSVVEHKHLHVEHRNTIMDKLREEPPAVQRFVAIANRMPTKTERTKLIQGRKVDPS